MIHISSPRGGDLNSYLTLAISGIIITRIIIMHAHFSHIIPHKKQKITPIVPLVWVFFPNSSQKYPQFVIIHPRVPNMWGYLCHFRLSLNGRTNLGKKNSDHEDNRWKKFLGGTICEYMGMTHEMGDNKHHHLYNQSCTSQRWIQKRIEIHGCWCQHFL